MASTAHKKEEDKVEYFDPEEVLDEKVGKIADAILKSKYFIAFTGAGISTSTGIPDFRSGKNTVLPTGPGAWQKRAQNIKTNSKKNVDMNRAIPSFTHMALIALEKRGFLKFLVSQNTDGLHFKSGFNLSKLAQLHGNRCIQKCEKCGKKYVRDFRTREAKQTHDHKTTRKCQKCRKFLHDTILNFGQYYPEDELEIAENEGQKADVCLAMGSSFYVKTASEIPKTVGKNGKLIIVNLQKTPLDQFAYVRVNALCDDFMKKLAKKMELKIDEFVITRMIKFDLNKEMEMIFRGVDKLGRFHTFLKQVEATYDKKQYQKLKGEPFKVSLQKNDEANIKFFFYGWHGEAPLQIQVTKEKQGILKIVFNPEKEKWIQEQIEWIPKV